MTDTTTKVREHYSATGLTDRIKAALAAITPEDQPLTVAQLAPLDQFHTRGILATTELAGAAGLEPSTRVLDLGCGIGGPARYLVMPADVDDVAKALDLAQDRGLPWVALGLGSNVLVKDGGFPGVVIRMGKGLDRFEMKGATAIVGAGLPTPLLARRTAEAGFAGVERFIGIPGTVGGGVYVNAGAHGAEFAEVLTEATVMDAKGKIRQVLRKQISFKYRSSNLGTVIVLEAKLALIEEPPAKLKELQGRLLRWRKAGTPFDQPCAGSVFKNPGGPRTAGALIDECGLKGFTIGGAQVSSMHANYMVNTGTATGSDVLKLIEHVRKTVAKKTGVELELEVKVIGV